MPPRKYSRYSFCTIRLDAGGRSFLDDRVPFGYVNLPDNRTHLVQQGDTLFGIAGRMFAPLVRPAGLWWVIADFQPQPIHDPTIQLQPGRVLYVPSLRTVNERIFSEGRRIESEL